LIGVVGQQREPDVIRFGNCPSQTAAINIADFEILKEPAFPPRFYGHDVPPLLALKALRYSPAEH